MNESAKQPIKSKLLISALCLILLLVMMLSTSLAWFTDSKSNVNTMVAGRISIEQTETDAEGEPFVGSNFVMMPSQTIVKKVTVENTGNQPCYLRTLFAFEDSDDGKVLEKLTTTGKIIEIPGVTNNLPKVQFTVTKGGKTTTYTIGYYVHPSELSYEDDKDEIVVLESIKLNADATNDWQNAVGEKYELFVLSQATQTSGMSTVPMEALNIAFGSVDAAHCAQWFGTVLASHAEYSGADVQAN